MKTSGVHMSYPAPLPGDAAPRVSCAELTRAFAPPPGGAHRGPGRLAAGGPLSNKYRYRIDPIAATAAPFVPLPEVQ